MGLHGCCRMLGGIHGGMHSGMHGGMHRGMMRGCNRPIIPKAWGNMQCKHMDGGIKSWVSHNNNSVRQLGKIISDGVIFDGSLSTNADEYVIVQNDLGFRYLDF